MQEAWQSSWNIRRGVHSSLLWGLAGMAVFGVMACGIGIVGSWQQPPPVIRPEIQPRGILMSISQSFVWFLFSGVFAAAAGWVSSAPRVQGRFALALALVFLVSLPLGIVAGT